MSHEDLYRDLVELDEEGVEDKDLVDALWNIYNLYEVSRAKCREAIQKFREDYPYYPKPNIM